MPRIWIFAHTPFPREDGTPSTMEITIVISTAFFLVILNLSTKEDTTASRRVVFRYLQSKEAVTELFKEISVKIADRPGGFTRILKTGNRLGDNAKTCFIELVDYNENMLKEKVAKKATRTRRSKKSAAPAAVTAEAPAAVTAEAPVSEAPATPTEEKAAE